MATKFPSPKLFNNSDLPEILRKNTYFVVPLDSFMSVEFNQSICAEVESSKGL